ncbi:MAG TPA: APC family permease [Microlunatus sp.]|nr:APC family permease [Microlunatus sp.]
MTVRDGHLHGNPHGKLGRSVGFYGLMFVSLGSIIGSGWLLSAESAAQIAGPAAILSWVLAAVMLTILALVFAELGATYPVAGGTGRFPYFSHGPVTGFFAGWSSWLQAVAIAPIEILAAIEYANSTQWTQSHFNMLDDAGNLNWLGTIVAFAAMILFTCMNLAGAKFMSESNAIVVIWKTAIPVLAIIVVCSLSFNPGNLTAGGGFMPHGIHGVLAALPAGVVFALQGFEQAVQLAGEARDPKKDISRAIITAMAIGATLYIALQFAFLVGVDPANVAGGWDHPLGPDAGSSVGAWYTLALAVGAGWLGTLLLIDAIISPAGTGIVYLGTTARLSYALGEEEEMPSQLARTNRRRVPVVSILVAAVVGCISFVGFGSWASLVNAVTGATAIMYALAPVSLAALRQRDPDRNRPYQMPFPKVLLPVSFAFSSLLIYWGGWNTMWKLLVALLVGLMLYGYGVALKETAGNLKLRSAVWIGPWMLGLTLISLWGNYGEEGDGHKSALFPGTQWDIVIVTAFALVIYYWAVNLAMSPQAVQEAIAVDADEIEGQAPVVNA